MFQQLLEALKSVYFYMYFKVWPKFPTFRCCTRELAALDPREKIFDEDDLDSLNMIFNYYKKKR